MRWGMRLCDVKLGGSVRINALGHTGAVLQRLQDLGFTFGCEITPLFRAPSGDPTAYGLRGSVIALRFCDAALIEVAI